jgi:hypothetical protein
MNSTIADVQSYYPATSTTVFVSSGRFLPTTLDKLGAPYNYSEFDYGFPEDPRSTWTSTNAGVTGFRWNLARNLLFFPPDLSRGAVVASNSTIEAGYCMFYIDMQVISARVHDGVYEETTLNASTLIEPFPNKDLDRLAYTHDIVAGEQGNLTFNYVPDCMHSMPSADCDRLQKIQGRNITIPRQRYSNVLGALWKILPTTNLTTGLRQQALVAGAGSAAYAAESL